MVPGKVKQSTLMLLALLLAGAARGKSDIDPEADRILREMSDFLGAQRQFTVRAESTIEYLAEGQKLQMNRVGDVKIARPDKLRVDRQGDLAEVKVFYDGKSFTVYEEKSNLFATIRAPSTLDATLKMLAEGLELYPPGSDLLYTRPYAVLTEDVQRGRYLGRSMIDGVPVHHLAFSGSEVDIQIWVEDGPRPLPRKYVLVSKNMPQAPEYSVVLKEWNLSPELSPELFTFETPAGAQRISFAVRTPEPSTRARKGGVKR